MLSDDLLPLIGFAIAGSWTPGPNTVMLAASGATFGWRATMRHVMGITVGFPVMLFAVALGLGETFERLPGLRLAMAWVGAAVMLWFAWRIASAAPVSAGTNRSRPLGFFEAAGFQWINPKAWTLAIGVSATYASGANPVPEALTATFVFAAAGIVGATGWAVFGSAIGRLLGTGPRLRTFNVVMGVLLAASAIALVVDA
ncbi:MAG: LysE family translocator [Pseudomonadota bacterium]